MEWIKKEDATPEIGQLILIFWPAKVNPVKGDPLAGAEVACMRYKEWNGKPWYCEFLWGSGRFGHRSEKFATHWMPIPEFPNPTLKG